MDERSVATMIHKGSNACLQTNPVELYKQKLLVSIDAKKGETSKMLMSADRTPGTYLRVIGRSAIANFDSWF